MKVMYTGVASNQFVRGKIYIVKIWTDSGVIFVKNLYGKEYEKYNTIKDLYLNWEAI